MLKESIKKVVESQREALKKKDCGIDRELLFNIDLKVPHAIIISGIRRCGKSTLLLQLMKKTPKFYYLNFEDQRLLDFTIADFEKLDEVFHEIYGEGNHYYFDEIQNVKKWESYVRKMQDLGKKFVITGSNASLLSRELGTKLTGRQITKRLYPFSYKEMLKLKNLKPSLFSFENYFLQGGFPEYLKYQNNDILQEVFKDIIMRDVIVRHKLRDVKIIQELGVYLLSNTGKEFSYNKLKEYFHMGSANSIINYIDYFEDSYLLFTLSKFDYSLKKQIINPKKVYSIDSGFARINSIGFSKDKGRVLENMVFLHLKRKNQQVYYWKDKQECDFVIKEKEKIVEAIQVCYELNEDNKEREIKGLLEAMKKFGLKKGLILTYNQDDKIDAGIVVRPVWKWLLC